MFFYLGPVAIAIICLIDSQVLVKNMGFWYNRNLFSVFIFQQINIRDVPIEQMFFYNIQVVIRSLIIAIRYGYFHDEGYSQMSRCMFKKTKLEDHLIMTSWIFSKLSSIDQEIEATVWRNRVDEENFKCYFMENIEITNPELQERLVNVDHYKGRHLNIKIMRKYVKQHEKLRRQKSLLEANFPAHMNEEVQNSKNIENGSSISMAHQVNSSQKIESDSESIHYGVIMHSNWDEILYSSVEFVGSLTLIYQNYLFVFIGLIDFKRRKLMINAIGAMAEPIKQFSPKQYRYLPTVNLLCLKSLNTWVDLRICSLDIGKRYLTRIFLYSSIYLGFYLFFAIVLLLSYTCNALDWFQCESVVSKAFKYAA
ncbi:UNKNOWN [Stylonychia lemnae]|uniref:Uncharacterized protein n=1 Tax=Stylonychia lemnae TaxID=5949 RepID=A0A077ZNQ1_STYLE|nr:UNKNOWN [Stylonychia lemnae]|eukprot:CDW71548.1 UNKNOWN [Stylonychia lemnae]